MAYTISWPLVPDNLLDGIDEWEHTADTLSEARGVARIQSSRHGHATITDRAGLVETWAGGAPVPPFRQPEPEGITP